VAAAEQKGEITVVDLAGGAALGAVPAGDHGGVAAFAVAPDGGAVALVHRDRTLSLIGARQRRDRRDLAPPAPLVAFAVAATGKLFAGAGEDGRVLLWDTGGPRLSSFAAAGARALAFSPDTKNLAVGLDHRVALRDLGAGQDGPVLTSVGRVQALAFAPDGLGLAAGTESAVELFAAGAARPERDVRIEGGPVRTVRFAPDGRTLVAAAREGVVLWEPDGRKATRLVAFGPEPRDVAFTPDGAGLIVAGKRGELLFGKAGLDGAASGPKPRAPAEPIEASSAPLQTVLVPTQALALAVAANGMLATAEGDRAVALRGPDGKVVARFKAPEAAVRAVAFLPQGTIAASCADGAIRLFRPPGPGPVATLAPVPGLPAGALAGVIAGPGGHLEIVGPEAAAARAVLRCRLGAALVPFEVCAEQFEMKDLLALILSGQDPAEVDP
jgi:WD40 repeat protein